MFTSGQIAFGIAFAIAFILVMIYTYRKDLKLHQKYYRGSVWVLIAFIAFIGFIAAVKFIFM